MLGILILKKYIQKESKRMTKSLLIIFIMMELGFLCEKKILARLKQKTTFALMFCYENRLAFTIYISDQEFENSMDLLLVLDENKSQ